MAVQRVNITLAPVMYEEFRVYATNNGLSISRFVAAKMKEYIKEQKEFQEYKENKIKGLL